MTSDRRRLLLHLEYASERAGSLVGGSNDGHAHLKSRRPIISREGRSQKKGKKYGRKREAKAEL